MAKVRLFASVKGEVKGGVFILIALAAVIVIAAFFVFNKNKAGQPALNQPTANTGEADDNGFPSEFFSYSGAISDINQDSLTLVAPANGNYLTEDTEFKILFDASTKFVKVTANKIEEPLEEGPVKLFERQPITIAEIKLGDQATVIAFENIKGKLEFLAKQIEVR